MAAVHDIETLRWIGDVDGHLELIDQTLLPGQLRYLACRDVETVWEAIKQLRVRGAPAIGIAAAYGLCLGIRSLAEPEKAAGSSDAAGSGDAMSLGDEAGSSDARFFARLDEVANYLAGSRPTAVNLFWALDRMRQRAERMRAESLSQATILAGLLDEARTIHDEDRAMCHAIGRYGAELLSDGSGVLTH